MLGVQSLGPLAPRRVAEGIVREASGVPLEPAPVSGHSEMSSERDAWVTLLGVPGLGPVTFASLLAAFGSARAVLDEAAETAGPSRLREALAHAAADRANDRVEAAASRSDPTSDAWHGRRADLGADLARRICESVSVGARTVELVRSLGLTVVTLDDTAYPDRLRRVDMPPPLLFVRGSIDSLAASHSIAVVGTRRPSDKGRLVAGWIGSGLARAGAVVVSGLAVGIDGAAHAAVVGEGLATVAILGGGHARLFPRAHERLADAIVAAGGAVIAELAPETPASRGTFPRRNRLVSGLSDAVVVVEAGRRSGALITAGWALEQGRECFLVPGPIDSPTSAGCNAFLRTFPGQARVVCGVPELIEDLGLAAEDATDGAGDPTEPGRSKGHAGAHRAPSATAAGAGRAAAMASLGPVERLLAECLVQGPATADDLAARTSLPGAAILSALTLLELRGFVSGSYGRYIPAGLLARWPGSHQREPV
ncbi:MAG: DNA-processing protein DprA [Candidatus Limnocylindrales bacterium]